MRDFKKYTSKQIDQAISENPFESRKEWMLWIACLAKSAGFNRAGQRNSNNKNFPFWQQDNHLFELQGNDMLQQKLLYMHDNPVSAGLVYETWHYKYSSANDYHTGMKGLLNLQLL